MKSISDNDGLVTTTAGCKQSDRQKVRILKPNRWGDLVVGPYDYRTLVVEADRHTPLKMSEESKLRGGVRMKRWNNIHEDPMNWPAVCEKLGALALRVGGPASCWLCWPQRRWSGTPAVARSSAPLQLFSSTNHDRHPFYIPGLRRGVLISLRTVTCRVPSR